MKNAENNDSRAIGVFDSGIGGLTCVRELSAALPDEQLIYLGDTLRCPYGDRSAATIREFTREIASFLLRQDVKMLIAACNTVSSVALDAAQDVAGGIPVIGVVEPGCRAAIEGGNSKKVGVIGTRATVSAHAYAKGIQIIAPEVIVYEKSCPLLVHLVEEGEFDSEIIARLLNKYLKELLDLHIDTLVLGCTHYPLLYDAIKRVVGERVSVINGAKMLASEAKKILVRENILSSKRNAEDILFATEVTEQFERLVGIFLQGSPKNIRLVKLSPASP